MKKIFVLLAFVITFASQTIAITADSTNISNAERIIDKYSDKAYTTIVSIADRLEGPAKEVFHYVTMKNFAQGIAGFAPALLFLMLFYYYFPTVKKMIKENKCDADHGAVFVVGWGLALLALGILTISTFQSSVMHIIAPEWYAIQDIVSLIK